MDALDKLLEQYREAAVTEREKGTYFERLTLAYLKNDPIQKQLYSNAWTHTEWAHVNGEDGKDIGIDLVAEMADGSGFAAIQCKFYAPHKKIAKKDIDSFLSASSKSPFVLRVFIDTTEADWNSNAENTITNQSIPVIRIGLQALRESSVDWSQFDAEHQTTITLKPKKSLRLHQQQALEAVENGFNGNDRGKLIMACGTGKTYTSLKIAEHLAGKGKRVLFLVPSLALISQTVREWTSDTETELRSFAVCSDSQVGQKRKSRTDIAEVAIHELEFPATTKPEKLLEKAGTEDANKMTVIFSTYQSIPVINAAQEIGLQEFDLIICDEAHRTTGATLDGEESSNFVRIHDNNFIKGSKRLYMTATPKIFGDAVRAKASDASIELCDMDDESLYGPTFFTRGFSWAVENGMLTDYKVIVLAMDESVVSRTVQGRLAADNELLLDDATKIIGCYKALQKYSDGDEFGTDPNPMQRAIAFCRDIKSSKLIESEFSAVAEEYNQAMGFDNPLNCSVQHVDGSFNAKTRGELLHWISDDVAEDECKILSNARCLSEGVDVAALDAILFLHPRKSQIDVVQSVGRVMRRAEDKKLGYVILPVVVPAGVAPEQALNDNERYKVVWQILNALRAHDDRFDATINKLDINKDSGGQIEVVAVSETLPTKNKSDSNGIDIGSGSKNDGEEGDDSSSTEQQTSFIFDEFPAAIKAKIVEKCGTRTYWEDWAKDVGKIAQQHIERIEAILETDSNGRQVFDEFLTEIRDDLNSSVTENEAIEMLAQHLITKPVFEALFGDYDFTSMNPVSSAMQKVVETLEEQNIQKESESLEGFYASVKKRAEGIDNDEGKQKIIVELYEKFFKNAFSDLSEKLGIVYTPTPVVDFIIHSVNDVLRNEFNQTLGSKGVHILDPFTGTGTFITRLLQSGLISKEEIEHKYKNEIHANEIVLLAYYIAAINIESTFHSINQSEYTPFNGICLTDTFEMYESDDLVAELMVDNSERRNRQKELDIRVIIGNPPYNVANTGVEYKNLNQRIADTYAAHTNATNKNSLYDSYILALRWASDRVKDCGVVAFVTNGGWIDGKAMDGMRKCMIDDFSSLYIFNLRGNQRTKGELSRQEGGKIFGQGSRAPVVISILVKNPSAQEQGKVFYKDIGDYLTREQKLQIIDDFSSIDGIHQADEWVQLTPDKYNDWINQRDDSFYEHILSGNKKDASSCLFSDYTSGVKTQRDAWCYNYSPTELVKNLDRLISHHNNCVDEGSLVINPKQCAWTDNTKKLYSKGEKLAINDGVIRVSTYRPFTKQALFYSKKLNERTYQTGKIYPADDIENKTIAVTGAGSKEFSALMFDNIPCLDSMEKGQNLPLYIYQKTTAAGLFSESDGNNEFVRSSGITDFGLHTFQTKYGRDDITETDIFHYTYAILHSKDYRSRYKENLTKEMPRIPAVNNERDFWFFVKAGYELAAIHTGYDDVEKYPVTIAEGDLNLAVIEDEAEYFRVNKMKFGGKKPNEDKTTIHYNNQITLTNIPLRAYDYYVNGKSAIEWVMERQAIKTDPKTGILNDPNNFANEVMANPAYPLELLQRVITVSLETLDIVESLPQLDID
ncbi:DEAD/DEAH box helicase [Neptuniibacter sp. QD29_5]|uniref:DEAD/DEAH box helicase n=1 Tax=Neptuniibacter sp. QD29_5 TaxID=3398207 RepID=UPI0039F601E9